MRTWLFDDRDQLLAAYRLATLTDGPALLRSTRKRDETAEFARAVVDGFAAAVPCLDCRFLYDAEGSRLYECICDQPEYYPTRTEAAILERSAPGIRRAVGDVSLIELGSGTSVKTDHLLAAWEAAGDGTTYVPVDVSGSALEAAARSIGARRPTVRFIGVNATYDEAFPLFPAASPALVFFLGSTIGNFDRRASEWFWSRMAAALRPGDFFMLGVDLVKAPSVLEAAYDDAAGVTAAFTRNLFARINRELGASIDLDDVRHEARYDEARDRVEIHARFLTDQKVDVRPLDTAIDVPAGTRVLTEISRKFRLEKLIPALAQHGFATREIFTDEQDWFAVLLLQRSHPND